MDRLYIMPMVTNTTPKGDRRDPKYLSTFNTFSYYVMDYGVEPACLVLILDIDTSSHNSLNANTDVIVLPQDIDQQIGANLNATRNALEALNIPGNWAQATDTFREVLRTVCWIFQFLQRLSFINVNRLLSGTVNLNTRWNQLSSQAQQDLLSAANSLNLNTTGLSGNTQLRAIFKNLADQMSTKSLNFGPLII